MIGDEKWGVTANRDSISLWVNENVLKSLWWWLHKSVNLLKTIELYTLTGLITWCVIISQ